MDVTYFRWRKEYGGLKGDQARRLKELERENQFLKRIVADLSVEKAIFKDAAEIDDQIQVDGNYIQCP
jgi:hypothetical protein